MLLFSAMKIVMAYCYRGEDADLKTRRKKTKVDWDE